MSYSAIRSVLIAALAAALTVTFAAGLAYWGLVLSAAIMGLLCFAIYVYRGELAKIYQAREVTVSRQAPSHKRVWGVELRLIDFAPGLIISGPLIVAMGYYVLTRPERPSGLLGIMYDVFGPMAIPAFFCVLGTISLVYGAEAIIGHRLSTRDT